MSRGNMGIDSNRGAEHNSSPRLYQVAGDAGELLSESEMAALHAGIEACQTLYEAIDFYTALDALSPQQRYQIESSVSEDTWAALWNLPEFLEPVLTTEPELEPDQNAKEPTLSELIALILACNTLVQLNELKRNNSQTFALAYSAMSQKEQAVVDALAATSVPHRVFKYVGDEIKLGTERLLRGMLVYIDQKTQVRANASNVPVWAINGVSSGWVRPIHVSISLLHEVVKAVLPDSEDHNGNQQLDLI